MTTNAFDWREPAQAARMRNRELQRMPMISDPVFVVPRRIVAIACLVIEVAVMTAIPVVAYAAWVVLP